MDELVAKLRDIHAQRKLKFDAAKFTLAAPTHAQAAPTPAPALASARPPGLVLAPEVVKHLLDVLAISPGDLLLDCATYAAQWAHAPLSDFHVGAAALSSTGAIVLGVNVEFPNLPLHHAMHAEQFTVARLHRVGGELRALATTASPCGHCRQFLQEVRHAEDARVLFPANGQINALRLEELLPQGFGPGDLDVHSRVLDPPPRSLALATTPTKEDADLAEMARKAAESAHVPYTQLASGVAVEVNGSKGSAAFAASAIECAAYNPSLGPLYTALASVLADEHELSAIARVVLVEQDGQVSYAAETRLVVPAIAPNATVHVYQLQNSE